MRTGSWRTRLLWSGQPPQDHREAGSLWVGIPRAAWTLQAALGGAGVCDNPQTSGILLPHSRREQINISVE